MHYRIAFPADYKNIPPLRDMAVHVAKLEGFSEKQSEHLRSVVDELCNNAIEHGSQPNSEVTLEVHSSDSALKVVCTDQGVGNKMKAEEILKQLDEKAQALEGGDAEHPILRGRGISMIIRSFVDEFHLEDGKDGGIVASVVINKDETSS